MSLAFIIDVADHVHATRERVRPCAEQSGLKLRTFLDPAAALATLEEGSEMEAAPALVLLGPRLEQRLALARRLHRAAPLTHIIFLADAPDSELEQQLRSPMALIGSHWSLVSGDGENLAASLAEAAKSAKQRQAHRTTLNRMNAQLSSHPPADASELRRYSVSDRFLASILEQAGDAIVATNERGTVITCNASAQSLFGMTADAAVGRHIGTLCEGEWSGLLTRLVEELPTARDNMVKRELACRRHDGQPLEIELSVSMVRDIAGDPLGVSVVARDVRERNRVEATLRASEARYRTVTETASDGIITIDADSNIRFFNRAAERIFGYAEQELIGQKLTVLMPPEFRDVHTRRLRNYAGGGQRSIPWSGVELRGLGRDGHEIPLEVSFGEFSGNGEHLFTGIVRDISERKQAEERFRLAVEAAPNAMVMSDSAGAIVLVNRQAELLFGYSRKELMSMVVEDLIPPRFRGGHPALREGYFASPDTRPTGAGRNLYAQRKDGREVPVEIGLTPVRTAGGTWVLSAIIDNTLRRELEDTLRGVNEGLERRVAERTRELRAANESLERSNIELRRFAYVASHDLQSPLRSISGFLQLLQEDYGERLDAQANHWIDRSVDNTHRMQRLIHDLLTYSQVESRSRPFELIDCREIVEQVAETLEPSIREAGAEIVVDDLPQVYGDRFQLTQLLQNLIENGIKYNGSATPEVRVSARAEGNEWLFSVRDNGIGMEPNQCERIFEIFHRLHGQGTYPGTGIGLALCRHVVERHGGRIWAESQPDAGSEFIFALPRWSPKS